MSRFGECDFTFWKTHKCKSIPNWTRKTVWLPINNINEKICMKDVLNFRDSELSSKFCVRAKPQVILIITQSRKHCAIITPSRACAWFEIKRFDWLSVNFFVHWPIRMLALLPVFAFNYLFCTVLRKICTVLSQSESSNFFMYITRSEIICVISKSKEHATRVRFEITSMMSDQNCMTQSSITTLLNPFWNHWWSL